VIVRAVEVEWVLFPTNAVAMKKKAQVVFHFFFDFIWTPLKYVGDGLSGYPGALSRHRLGPADTSTSEQKVLQCPGLLVFDGVAKVRDAYIEPVIEQSRGWFTLRFDRRVIGDDLWFPRWFYLGFNG